MSGKLKVTFFASMMVVAFLLSVNSVYPGNAFAAGKTAIVSATSLNVRSGPGTNYRKVGAAVKGAKLQVLDQKGNWYKVKLSNGKSGWVINTYLGILKGTSAGSSSSKPDKGAKEVKIVVVKSNNVNVRSGPATGYGKVSRVNKGQEFAMVKESGGWYQINLGKGKYGWIANWLVSLKTQQTPANSGAGNTGTGSGKSGGSGSDKNGNHQPGNTGNGSGTNITSGTYLIVKGTTVNVRTGAGTGFSVMAKVKAGEQFTIVRQSGDWFMVNLSSNRQGWIAGWLAEIRSVDNPSRGDPNSPNPPNPPKPEPETPGSVPGTPSDQGAPQPTQKLTGIDYQNGANGEELLIIKSEGAIKFSLSSLQNPARLVIDIENCDVNSLSDFTPSGTMVGRVRVAQYSLTPMAVRVVLDLNKTVSHLSSLDESGQVLTVSLSEPSIKGKVIVIDAGHGGYDPGATGITGLEEKEFNLDTALRLRDKLAGLGANVLLTREGDTFISLSERTTVANNAYADVFVSIHANSSDSSARRGTSTYYYAPSSSPGLYAQFTQRQKLAAKVQDSLVGLLGTNDVGILQANFAVLRGTAMPSVLVETAFVSNTDDEALLRDGQFRDKAAQAIADGLVGYFAAGD